MGKPMNAMPLGISDPSTRLIAQNFSWFSLFLSPQSSEESSHPSKGFKAPLDGHWKHRHAQTIAR